MDRRHTEGTTGPSVLMGEITARLQEALGDVPIVCAVVERGDKLRVWSAPGADRRPSMTSLKDNPSIAAAIAEGRNIELTPEEARRFGVDRAIAVPFAGDAGAIGACCHVLLPKTRPVLWYWGYRGETTPWYPSLQLLRSDSDTDWGPFIAQVARMPLAPHMPPAQGRAEDRIT